MMKNMMENKNEAKMEWKYYSENTGLTEDIEKLITIFEEKWKSIDSDKFKRKSNDVLKSVSKELMNNGYKVERGKKDKIPLTVLNGINAEKIISFEVDAFSKEKKILVEVEAGRAVANYQFLKDFFEACMLEDVDYLCICVRKKYINNKDFETVTKFFDALCLSERMSIPLKGILIIGY